MFDNAEEMLLHVAVITKLLERRVQQCKHQDADTVCEGLVAGC